MRTRVLLALLAFSAVAVLAFAVPLALATSDARTHQLMLSRDSALDWFAVLAHPGVATGGEDTLQDEVDGYHALFGEAVLITDSAGTVRHTAGLDPTDPAVGAAIDAARRNEQLPRPVRLSPWSDDSVLLARTIGTGVHSEGVIVLRASTTQAKADIARSWLLIAAGAAAAMAVVAGLALALARWVLRPLDKLQSGVAALTHSLPTYDSPTATPLTAHYTGPPEIRVLARSFDAMTHAVLASSTAQRQLIADTAHKLRNPLAALQIRLDLLTGYLPDTLRPSLERAGSETQRLGALLDGMLRLSDAEVPHGFEDAAGGTAGSCDAVAVAAERVDAWDAALTSAGMVLATRFETARLEVAIPATALAEILDAALCNAHRYAGPEATVIVSTRIGGSRGEVAVADDGPGVPAEEIGRLTDRFYRHAGQGQQGTGLGLSIAKALATTYAAQLRVEPAEPRGLRVVVSVKPL